MEMIFEVLLGMSYEPAENLGQLEGRRERQMTEKRQN